MDFKTILSAWVLISQISWPIQAETTTDIKDKTAIILASDYNYKTDPEVYKIVVNTIHQLFQNEDDKRLLSSNISVFVLAAWIMKESGLKDNDIREHLKKDMWSSLEDLRQKDHGEKNPSTKIFVEDFDDIEKVA
jgi:hypothetical protein